MDMLEDYLARGMDNVEGWLDTYSARFIADLLQAQQIAGVEGAFGEIGVHHGKLFLLMRLAARGSPGFAIDIFGDQHLNVDSSGLGDRARFEANLAAWPAAGGALTIFQRSSLDMTAEEILGAVGSCRCVSIDGGHTEACTLSDLRLADAVLHDQGVAILDDCFNEHWPDVVSGTARYLLDPATRLRPFAITPNKLYLAREAEHARLYALTEPRHGQYRIRESRMFGHVVNIYQGTAAAPPGVEMLDAMLAHAKRYPGKLLRHAVSRSPIGPMMIQLRNTLRGRTG